MATVYGESSGWAPANLMNLVEKLGTRNQFQCTFLQVCGLRCTWGCRMARHVPQRERTPYFQHLVFGQLKNMAFVSLTLQKAHKQLYCVPERLNRPMLSHGYLTLTIMSKKVPACTLAVSCLSCNTSNPKLPKPGPEWQQGWLKRWRWLKLPLSLLKEWLEL